MIELLLLARVVAALSTAAFAIEEPRVTGTDKSDPYTHGEPAALAKAGYVALGTFDWCEGKRTSDVAALLGDPSILFVETAHFRIASTLESYRVPNDAAERKKLEGEIRALKSRLERLPSLGAQLDPWLRLHLFARRIELEYETFEKTFGLTDLDFGPGASAIAEGPYLGMPEKPTVLLAEKQTTLEKFARGVLNRECGTTLRERLPGGSLFLGTSAEGLRTYGYQLDAALHAQVASDVVLNLLDGFRNNTFGAPVWFEYGLAFTVSRRIDERFTVYAVRAKRENDESVRWEPRVFVLAQGNYAPGFREMIGWKKFEDMDDRGQLSAWSHVEWLTLAKPAKLRALLLEITTPNASLPASERVKLEQSRQVPALEEALGKPIDALEEAWKKHVLEHYARK